MRDLTKAQAIANLTGGRVVDERSTDQGYAVEIPLANGFLMHLNTDGIDVYDKKLHQSSFLFELNGVVTQVA